MISLPASVVANHNLA